MEENQLPSPARVTCNRINITDATHHHRHQLLYGHAAIGPFLYERMTGPQRLESSECWWCDCGKRQSRHHLFTECRAWGLQIRMLWRRTGKDCHWEHPRAPAVRWLWKEEATEAVLEDLEDTRVGCRMSSEIAMVDEGRDEQEVPGSEGEEAGPGPP